MHTDALRKSFVCHTYYVTTPRSVYMKRAPVRDILFLFIVTRLLFVLVTYFGYILLTAPKYSSTPVDTATFFSLWNHWDAARYLSIARYGYQSKEVLAFFPLFPLLTAIFAYPLTFLMGVWSYTFIGMLISNVALLGALFVVYQLAVDGFGEESAKRSLLYLCIFPTALFFFAAYNESLFLLFTAAAFLALRRQRWWLAGLFGLLGALTRSTGIILVAPFLYELWLVRERFSIHYALQRIVPVLLIPLGTMLYAIYCWYVSGNPLEFANVQIDWARHLSWPWQGFLQSAFELFWHQPFGSFFQVHILLDLTATIGFIVLLILGRRSLRMSYTLWVALMLLSFLISPSTGQRDPFISNQRFVLELFPGFILLGVLSMKHPRLHQVLMLLFPPLLAVLSLIFVMNLWMV